MALIMTVFVTVFLLLVALGYLVCSRSSLIQSRLSQGEIRGEITAEAGMERSLWYVQQRYDMNNEIQETESASFGDYEQLLKHYRDNKKVEQYGVLIPKLGEKTRYAMKTVWEEDENVDNGKELAIYVIGVDKLASVSAAGETAMVKGMKMLIRVGARKTGWIEGGIVVNDQLNIPENSRVQGKGKMFSNTGIKDQITSNTTVADSNGNTNNQLKSTTNDKKLVEGTDIIAQSPKLTNINLLRSIPSNVSIDKEEKPFQKLPKFNIADFASSKGDYRGPDYCYNDLVGDDKKGWKNEGNVLVSSTDHMMNVWDDPPLQQDTNGNFVSDSNGNPMLDTTNKYVKKWMENGISSEAIQRGMYYDRNGDGYTTIYLDSNAPNLRVMPYGSLVNSMVVLPCARGVIASQGHGNNFYDANAKDGIVPRSYKNKSGGTSIITVGVDRVLNDNVSIEIRGDIWGSSLLESQWTNHVYKEDSGVVKRAIYANNWYNRSNLWYEEMGEKWGALSIIGENDVIISSLGSTTHVDDYIGVDPASVFRGFVYSEKNVQVQTDLLIQGMIMGKSATIADQGSLGWGMARMGDGGDLSFFEENVKQPSGGGKSFFPLDVAPNSSGGNLRHMCVLSWEVNKFYKN